MLCRKEVKIAAKQTVVDRDKNTSRVLRVRQEAAEGRRGQAAIRSVSVDLLITNDHGGGSCGTAAVRTKQWVQERWLLSGLAEGVNLSAGLTLMHVSVPAAAPRVSRFQTGATTYLPLPCQHQSYPPHLHNRPPTKPLTARLSSFLACRQSLIYTQSLIHHHHQHLTAFPCEAQRLTRSRQSIPSIDIDNNNKSTIDRQFRPLAFPLTQGTFLPTLSRYTNLRHATSTARASSSHAHHHARYIARLR